MDMLGQKSNKLDAEVGPRIALLTPYNGGNLGDAAIQDALIANLRLQMPGARFAGISLNNENFIKRHGVDAFPLCATARRFYAMSNEGVSPFVGRRHEQNGDRDLLSVFKDALKRKPRLLQCLKDLRRCLLLVPKELLHIIRGYRFICRQDILIVSGGGQLDEGWGGPWGHPFAILKWALLARMARVPFAFVSVGVGKTESPLSRLFLSAALRLACYRSYRELNSRKVVSALLKATINDAVVPDLAFALPISGTPADEHIRSLSQGRKVVAISPIAYAKPGRWPRQDQAVYERYIQQMARVMFQLVKRDYSLIMICSSLDDDESVIPEILAQLDEESGEKLSERIYVPKISSWQGFASVLQEVDFLIASRLHSTILGLISQRPIIAISFNSKVDWLMESLNQTDYLLQINNFQAGDVIERLDRLKLRRGDIVRQINSALDRMFPMLAVQHDALVELAMAGRRRRTDGVPLSFENRVPCSPAAFNVGDSAR